MKPTRRTPRGPRRRAASSRDTTRLTKQISSLLDWPKAHATFDAAVADIPPELRGRQPPSLPYSLWQLVEHLRLCQWDILDYMVNPAYKEKNWPQDYWPPAPQPPSPEAWDESIAGFKKDLAALKRLTASPKIDLLGDIPHARGVTYLRELLLVADHNAYHVGQIVAVRRMLGEWKK